MAGIPEAVGSSRSRTSGERALGQFCVGREIGKGSFAQVYVGYHKVRLTSRGVEFLRQSPHLCLWS